MCPRLREGARFRATLDNSMFCDRIILCFVGGVMKPSFFRFDGFNAFLMSCFLNVVALQAGPATDCQHPKKVTRAEAMDAVRTLISWAGDDPDRPGVLETPRRVVDSFAEFFEGYNLDPHEPMRKTFDDINGYQDMVLVRNIEFHSRCEHHMLPIDGVVHIAYVPNQKVVGLSKLPRVVKTFARRLQIQERMTSQIADVIQNALQCQGVMVFVEGSHHCMGTRGVNSQASTITTYSTGVFRNNPQLRREFMERISRSEK